MAENKDWYGNGVNELNNELKDTVSTINTFGLTRVLYIYSYVDSLMKLCKDYKKCDNYITKNLISKEMKDIVFELKHYKVFDDRFEELFDEGR